MGKPPKKTKKIIIGTATTLTPHMRRTPGELAIAERRRQQPRSPIAGWTPNDLVTFAPKAQPELKKKKINREPRLTW